MNMQIIEALPGVRATLNYLERPDHKPYIYTYEPPPGTAPRSGMSAAIPDILIRDARRLAGQLSLDVEGFDLRRHETKVADFYDDEEVRTVYYAEVVELVKQATGAERVVIFDHTLRTVPEFQKRAKGVREPVRQVHNDYTLASGVQRARDLLGPAEAGEWLRHHYAEINVWRPIKGPLEDTPLALCDASSVPEEDWIATDLIYRDRVGEIYNVAYSPGHRWFYFSKMQRDEVVLIKCYDSKEDGRARFTAHSGFADPTTPANALPRESIEVRALVLFGG